MSKKDTTELKTTISEIRSDHLSMSALLEYQIEVNISAYFDWHDTKHVSHVLFHNDNEFSFSKKINMLERLVQKNFPKFMQENPDLFLKLNRTRRLRNLFAHSTELIDSDLIPFIGKNYFKMGFFEGGKIIEREFTYDDMKKRNDDITSAMDMLQNLFEEIKQISK